PNVHTFDLRLLADRMDDVLRRLARLHECVTGWTPGALSHANSARAPDEIKRGGNARTCITIPALSWREIIAQIRFNVFEGSAEAGQIGLGHSREKLHDQHMTQMRHVGFLCRR